MFIPAALRALAGGVPEVAAAGATLRGVVEDVARQYPELGARLLNDGALRPEVFIAVGPNEAFGLDVPVAPDAEVFIIPAIAGGA